MAPRAVILGCEGSELSASEAAFFRDADPWGFILFARNGQQPAQLRALCDALRQSVGRDAVILIDQEGGRINRLKAPLWRLAPAPGVFGALFNTDAAAAREAWRLNCRLFADELRAVGITGNCIPCLDVPVPGSHDIIGDRAFSPDPAVNADLGEVTLVACAEAGLLPVSKHVPGHGRAEADSHETLPVVGATRAALETSDFVPFRATAQAPAVMTAHVVYKALDPDRPATTSPRIIGEIVRGVLGMDGLVMSDDLSMKALDGPLGTRAGDAIAAGCDVVLHCNGDRAEMEAVVAAVPVLEGEAARRAAACDALIAKGGLEAFDRAGALAYLAALIGPAAGRAGA